VRQSFQFKLFDCKRLRHLHRAIDVSAEIWNHSVALKNRYYKLIYADDERVRILISSSGHVAFPG
jgi:hypothetical protein